MILSTGTTTPQQYQFLGSLNFYESTNKSFQGGNITKDLENLTASPGSASFGTEGQPGSGQEGGILSWFKSETHII